MPGALSWCASEAPGVSADGGDRDPSASSRTDLQCTNCGLPPEILDWHSLLEPKRPGKLAHAGMKPAQVGPPDATASDRAHGRRRSAWHPAFSQVSSLSLQSDDVVRVLLDLFFEILRLRVPPWSADMATGASCPLHGPRRRATVVLSALIAPRPGPGCGHRRRRRSSPPRRTGVAHHDRERRCPAADMDAAVSGRSRAALRPSARARAHANGAGAHRRGLRVAFPRVRRRRVGTS